MVSFSALIEEHEVYIITLTFCTKHLTIRLLVLMKSQVTILYPYL